MAKICVVDQLDDVGQNNEPQSMDCQVDYPKMDFSK